MRVFYASEAVLSNGSEEIFRNDIAQCLSDSPFLTGYVFEADGEICGYAMTAHSYSTEFGKPCVWIEDLYLLPQYRRKGTGSQFFDFLKKEYPQAIFRLEVEPENEHAVAAYRKNGFTAIPYMEMIIRE